MVAKPRLLETRLDKTNVTGTVLSCWEEAKTEALEDGAICPRPKLEDDDVGKDETWSPPEVDCCPLAKEIELGPRARLEGRTAPKTPLTASIRVVRIPAALVKASVTVTIPT